MSCLINTLIISGGGSKNISVIGTLKYLDDKKILSNIKRYAGSSAGAIICLLLNIGYTPQEIEDTFFNQNSTITKDPFYKVVWNLYKNYGMNSGSKIVNYINSLLIKKGINKDITFNELKIKTDKILVITGSSLTDQDTYYFNFCTTPDMKVVDALRISISIPIFFTSINYTINNKNHIFIDGGILQNFPIYYFDLCDSLGKYILTANLLQKTLRLSNISGPNEKLHENILGIMLFLDGEIRDVDNFNNNIVTISNIGNFLSSYVNTLLLKIEIANFRDPTTGAMNNFFNRVISIKIPKTVSYTDFDLADDVKKILMENGKTAAEEFFSENLKCCIIKT